MSEQIIVIPILVELAIIDAGIILKGVNISQFL